MKRECLNIIAERKTYTVKIIHNLVYAAPHGKPLYIDLYLPEEINKPVPVIIWLHGGGWKLGDRYLGPDLSRYFAQFGYAMASIEYRLSGEAKFPAQIYDVKAAIRWIRSVSSEYNLDSYRICLWGSSSGGHLAALAGITGSRAFASSEDDNSHSVEVQAIIVGYPPVDFLQLDAQRNIVGKKSTDQESIQLPENMRAASPDSFESQFLGAPIETIPEKVRKANPIMYIQEGMPPFLIMHGLNDLAVSHHQSTLLYNELVEKNNEATLVLLEGHGHGFLNCNEFYKEPVTVKVQTSIYGKPEEVKECQLVALDVIESFFRKHLFGKKDIEENRNKS